MFKRFLVFTVAVAAFACGAAGYLAAQTPTKMPAENASAANEKGIELAERGLCTAALPLLEKSIPHIADKRRRYQSAMAIAQCAITVNRMGPLVEAVLLLNREFPNNPKVLYVTAHYYSELANRAAHKLLRTAPSSAEAQELIAEAMVARNQLDEAAAEYEKILQKYPSEPGIHYQLGRIIMSKPPTAATAEDAKKEFEAELKVDPTSSTAEFMLGDLAWKAQNWDEAIDHFSRATKLDGSLAEAFLGLGIAFNGDGKYSEAVAPLEKYVRMDTADPAGHYQLAIAYARTGQKEKADHQIALQSEAEKKVQGGAPMPQNPGQPR